LNSGNNYNDLANNSLKTLPKIKHLSEDGQNMLRL